MNKTILIILIIICCQVACATGAVIWDRCHDVPGNCTYNISRDVISVSNTSGYFELVKFCNESAWDESEAQCNESRNQNSIALTGLMGGYPNVIITDQYWDERVKWFSEIDPINVTILDVVEQTDESDAVIMLIVVLLLCILILWMPVKVNDKGGD